MSYSLGIKWIDGSLNQDIPIKELGTMFNVKQVIVSQVGFKKETKNMFYFY
jgi:predicted acylesterase/phospholipase RssA